jgi:hypothetical protein
MNILPDHIWRKIKLDFEAGVPYRKIVETYRAEGGPTSPAAVLQRARKGGWKHPVRGVKLEIREKQIEEKQKEVQKQFDEEVIAKTLSAITSPAKKERKKKEKPTPEVAPEVNSAPADERTIAESVGNAALRPRPTNDIEMDALLERIDDPEIWNQIAGRALVEMIYSVRKGLARYRELLDDERHNSNPFVLSLPAQLGAALVNARKAALGSGPASATQVNITNKQEPDKVSDRVSVIVPPHYLEVMKRNGTILEGSVAKERIIAGT